MSMLTRAALTVCLLAAGWGGWAMWNAPANAAPAAGCHLRWTSGVQWWSCPVKSDNVNRRK